MSKYLKPDTELGYIEDHAEIEYNRFNNLRHTILGCMLGDYDSNGVYTVSPQIIQELIAMPKYLTDSMENIEICQSALKLDKPITFMLTYQGDKVTLSLIEKVSFEANNKLNAGTYSNINEFILDQVEVAGTINKNSLYRLWNIQENGGEAIDVFNMDDETKAIYANIVNRFKYLLIANKILLENEEILEEIESIYANRLLDILQQFPELEKKVLEELTQTLEEKKDFVRIDKPNFSKTVNEILEKAIENNIGVLDEEQKEVFETEKHNALMEINILRREVIDIEVQPVEENYQTEIKDLLAQKPKTESDEVEPVVVVPVPQILKIATKGKEEELNVEEAAKEMVSVLKEKEEKCEKNAVLLIIPKPKTEVKTEEASEEKSSKQILVERINQEFGFEIKKLASEKVVQKSENITKEEKEKEEKRLAKEQAVLQHRINNVKNQEKAKANQKAAAKKAAAKKAATKKKETKKKDAKKDDSKEKEALKKAKALFEKGLYCKNVGNYKEAIKYFEDAKKLTKDKDLTAKCDKEIKSCKDAIKKAEEARKKRLLFSMASGGGPTPAPVTPPTPQPPQVVGLLGPDQINKIIGKANGHSSGPEVAQANPSAETGVPKTHEAETGVPTSYENGF